MKKIKKVLAFLTSVTAINAMSGSLLTSAYDETSEHKYIDSALTIYLNSYDVDCENIFISEPYNVYDIDNEINTNNVYVVFEADKVIGLLSVADTVNGYRSSFEYQSFAVLQNIYNNSESFCFVCMDMKLYIKQSDKVFSVDDEKEICQISSVDIAETKLDKSYAVDVENIIVGDIDSNDKIDISDATILLSYYAKEAAGLDGNMIGNVPLNDVLLFKADMNKDGVINIEDASAILKAYAEKAAGN